MLTDLQKQTAQAIINIFETGKVLGDYTNVTSVAGDPGGLTYGKAQTTLNSGNLFLLIKAYCDAENAQFAEELRAYLDRLEDKDKRLNRDLTLHGILRQAGLDPVMQDTQDEFFDRVYWNPSVSFANRLGIQTALGTAVVYDSILHGSWVRMSDRTINNFGTVANIGEKTWISHYVDVRRDWLASHPIRLLQKTVYRMDALKRLISNNNWDLTLPFNVRGLLIDEETLKPTLRLSSDDLESKRLLRLRLPLMQGEDVREVQEALSKAGFNIKVDAVFGEDTDKAVRQFQRDKNLIADGIVGQATRAELGL